MAAFSTTDINWNLLINEYPDQYKKRSEIVSKRTRYLLSRHFGTNCWVQDMDGDGNCMINSFLHQNEAYSKENALSERLKMVQFMNDNQEKFENAMDKERESINDYAQNYKYLDEIHLKALHLMYRVNVVVFEYHIETDNLSQNYYHRKEFEQEQCIFLLYSRHSKHYDLVHMDDAYTLPASDGYSYDPVGTKFDKLDSFDRRFLKGLYNERIDDEMIENEQMDCYYCSFWTQLISSIC